jgi:hypothetical protein
MDTGTIAVIGFCVLLVLWYVVGHLVNRRRGQALFHWLESGLDVLGGKREAGWLGTPASGARFTVIHAAPPFRRLEITLLLENREVPLQWLLGHLRGRRDGLIMKATLRVPRQGEVEVSPGAGMIVPPGEEGWTSENGPHGLAVAYRGTGARQQAEALGTWLETYGTHLHRLSWRRQDPHVQLHIRVAGLTSTPSHKILDDLRSTMERASHGNDDPA